MNCINRKQYNFKDIKPVNNIFSTDALTNKMLVTSGSDLRVQAHGGVSPSGGAIEIYGKFTADGEKTKLMLVNLTTFETTDKITDNAVYAADVTGFYSVFAERNIDGVSEQTITTPSVGEGGTVTTITKYFFDGMSDIDIGIYTA